MKYRINWKDLFDILFGLFIIGFAIIGGVILVLLPYLLGAGLVALILK